MVMIVLAGVGLYLLKPALFDFNKSKQVAAEQVQEKSLSDQNSLAQQQDQLAAAQQPSSEVYTNTNYGIQFTYSPQAFIGINNVAKSIEYDDVGKSEQLFTTNSFDEQNNYFPISMNVAFSKIELADYKKRVTAYYSDAQRGVMSPFTNTTLGGVQGSEYYTQNATNNGVTCADRIVIIPHMNGILSFMFTACTDQPPEDAKSFFSPVELGVSQTILDSFRFTK